MSAGGSRRHFSSLILLCLASLPFFSAVVLAHARCVQFVLPLFTICIKNFHLHLNAVRVYSTVYSYTLLGTAR